MIVKIPIIEEKIKIVILKNHIAYFLGFLVEKIYKKVNETESQ